MHSVRDGKRLAVPAAGEKERWRKTDLFFFSLFFMHNIVEF
jgi:hypothetical protein